MKRSPLQVVRAATAWFLFVCGLPIAALAAWMFSQILLDADWKPAPNELVFARVVFCLAAAIPMVSWVVLPKHHKCEPESSGSTETTRFSQIMTSYSLVIGVAPVIVFGLTSLSLYLNSRYQSHHAQIARREKLETASANRPSRELEDIPQDVADVPAVDLRAEGDEMKRYLLIGAQSASKPSDQYQLLLVMPGGDGGASFSPFVQRIYKNVLNDRWLVAQMVAPEWDTTQIRKNVWPRNANPYPSARFTTEEFAHAVINDVRSRESIKPNGIFLLAWSSGGPAAYSIALQDNTPVSGAFIAMSVFRPGELPVSFDASGKSFYLFQSPDDRITRFDDALLAESTLRGAGARVHLEPYDGGHGWRTGLRGMPEAFRWLEEPLLSAQEKPLTPNETPPNKAVNRSTQSRGT